MHEYKYLIEFEHKGTDGKTKFGVIVNGPHDFHLTDLGAKLKASLVRLDPDPVDPTRVKLKLTLTDEVP